MARQKPTLVRSIHVEAVVEALDGRTGKQVARIAQLSSALETGGSGPSMTTSSGWASPAARAA